jgi:hypothetical protein
VKNVGRGEQLVKESRVLYPLLIKAANESLVVFDGHEMFSSLGIGTSGEFVLPA